MYNLFITPAVVFIMNENKFSMTNVIEIRKMIVTNYN